MLLDAPADKTATKSRALAFTIAALALVALAVLWFTFRYYPEKKAAGRFFDAVVAGDMTRAYQLWKPGPSYQMNDFVADWGPTGYYGPVKSFKILKAKSPAGASGVIVTAEISPFSPLPDKNDGERSRKTRIVQIWVEAGDKSLSFPPNFQ
jgi:hypothetical protein